MLVVLLSLPVVMARTLLFACYVTVAYIYRNHTLKCILTPSPSLRYVCRHLWNEHALLRPCSKHPRDLYEWLMVIVLPDCESVFVLVSSVPPSSSPTLTLLTTRTTSKAFSRSALSRNICTFFTCHKLYLSIMDTLGTSPPEPSTPDSASSSGQKRRRQVAFYPNMNSTNKPQKPFSRSAAKRESVMALGSIEYLQHYFTKTGIAADTE